MKLWLIKFGKVINAIRRDGVMAGLSKASAGLSAMIKMMHVPAGDILIVTNGLGDSARYRAHHVAEELRLQGMRVSVTVQDNPLLGRLAGKFRVFIFHRTLYVGGVKKLYENAKKMGHTVIFDTDDLVYDPQYLHHMDFYQQMQKFERLQYENGVGGEFVQDPYVRVATTTTSFLADKLRSEGKEVFIVPNRLSHEDVQWAEEHYTKRQQILSERDTIDPDHLVIGYFSGTISHNKDFATITPALAQILAKYPHVRVAIFGPLDLDEKLVPYKEQFIQTPYAPRKEHFGNMARVDITVAPLELDNPFCEAKSELKFFEPGVLGVPTVAVGNRTFSEAISDGIDGFVARTTEEWVDKLSQLIDNPELRRRIGDAARETALARYTIGNAHNDDYYTLLTQSIHEKK
jgi:glycosyltransferase involved in cell wall biosynthesis